MARILVIDDEELVRASIAAVLRRSEHLITLAEDGEDALCKFVPGRFDLVITDIVMPRKEGIETVRALRRLDAMILIIAISGSGGTDRGLYLKAATALGANAALEKPFRAAELRRVVDDVLATPSAASKILRHRQPQASAAKKLEGAETAPFQRVGSSSSASKWIAGTSTQISGRRESWT